MLFQLALALATVLGCPHADPNVLRLAASAVEQDVAPLFGGQPEELAVLLEWAAHESHIQARPKSISKDSKQGVSHGILQQRADLPIDRQFTAWLGLLHQSREMCGSDEGALRMVSSGYCDRFARSVDRRLDDAWVNLEYAR